MANIDDGGAAFPCSKRILENFMDECGYWRTRTVTVEVGGMSLRDYFAAKAMHAELNTAGMLEGPRDALADAAAHSGRSVEDQIAFNAYELADAMLRARTGGDNSRHE